MLGSAFPSSPGRPLGCCPLWQPIERVSVENLWDLLSGAPPVSWAMPLSEGQDLNVCPAVPASKMALTGEAPGKTRLNDDRERGLSTTEH